MTRPIDWDAVRAHRATYEPPTATCSHCGLTFAPTVDGRLRHKMMNGHAPRIWVAPELPPLGISPRCRAGAHTMCGGGFLRQNGPAECGCGCGHYAPRERDWNGPAWDTQGDEKTARDGEGNTDPGLTDTLNQQERLMSKSTREPASRPPFDGER